MTTVYIVSHELYRNNTYEKELLQINHLKPDKIVCLCMEELGMEVGEPHYIFRKFFDIIKPWLLRNNKVINLVIPHMNDTILEPGVITESCQSLIFLNGPDVINSNVAPFRCMNVRPRDRADILYTCYINNARVERAMLIEALAKNNLIKHGMVTLRYPERPVALGNKREVFPWKYHDGSRLIDEPEFVLNGTDFPANAFPKSFLSGVFDVVAESRYNPGEFFLTEKTIKSIAAAKPFMVLGCKGFHSYLRDFFGFKLYDDMFDYSFDECDRIEDRIEGIVQNILRLHALGRNEQGNLYTKCVPSLLYNRYKVAEIYYDKNKIVPKSLRFLMDGGEHTVYVPDRQRYPSILYYMERMGWIKNTLLA
jgi:hypothetical protein